MGTVPICPPHLPSTRKPDGGLAAIASDKPIQNKGNNDIKTCRYVQTLFMHEKYEFRAFALNLLKNIVPVSPIFNIFDNRDNQQGRSRSSCGTDKALPYKK